MRTLGWVCIVAAFAPCSARAVGPSAVVAPRAPEAAYLVTGGTVAFGVGAAFASGWSAELRVAPSGGYAEALGGRGWDFGREGWFAARLRLDGALTVPYLGPRDLGVGVWGTATGGLGGERFEVFLGAQAGAEGFANPLEARFPVRLLAGLRARVGPVEAQLFGRGGVDVQPGGALAYRGDLVLALGYVLAPR